MNKLIVTGILSNPEMKMSANGTPVLNFSVADSFKKKGNRETNWWSFQCYGKRAESLQWLKHKMRVTCIGHVEQNKSNDKTYYNVILDDIDVQGDPTEGEETVKSKPSNMGSIKDFEDDIPF